MNNNNENKGKRHSAVSAPGKNFATPKSIS